jgi:hypothetical protein
VFSLAFLIFPPLALLFYIQSFGVSAVFWDEWDNVSLLQKATSGALRVQDLFAQANEFRPFFPRLLMIALDRFTRFNTIAEMVLSWSLLCLTGLLIFFSFRKNLFYRSSRVSLLLYLPVSLLLFSFRQFESILWGINLLIYMGIFGSVAAFYFLGSGRTVDLRFAVSLLCGVLASFSWSTGLFVWPIGLLQILISKRRSIGSTSLWTLIGIVVWSVYSYGWYPIFSPSQYAYSFQHHVEGIEFFLANLASPFVLSSWLMAFLFGLVLAVVGLVIMIQMIRGGLAKKSIFGLSLVMYSVAASVATTVGRSFLGVPGALASRYTPNAAIGIIGLYILVLSISRATRTKRSTFGAYALLALLLLGLISGYVGGWQAGQYWHDSMQISAYVLKTYSMQSDAGIRTYLVWDPAIVRAGAPFLEAQKLNVFSEPSVNLSTLPIRNSLVTAYGIDTCPGSLPSIHYGTIMAPCSQHLSTSSYAVQVINSTTEETITITGWAVDVQDNSVASAVFIVIDGQIVIPTLYGLTRPDVADSLKNTNFENSGFIALFSSSVLRPGQHTVVLEIVSKNLTFAYVTPQADALVIEN